MASTLAQKHLRSIILNVSMKFAVQEIILHIRMNNPLRLMISFQKNCINQIFSHWLLEVTEKNPFHIKHIFDHSPWGYIYCIYHA